ncbi:hypothetical protein VVD49_10705 [Uliginosibacterium sp. H3]|uniref:DUF2474 domain-containing protein n=1 Tax=Uliginosibacterium silvisoli TaxID=3114758 RepID=A0ABU6K308_9RHOO|nr:hypothetical protein [Uliginosibacterium sp. H3]
MSPHTAPVEAGATHAVSWRHWLVLGVWLAGSLAVLGAFEYQSALRGLLCGG